MPSKSGNKISDNKEEQQALKEAEIVANLTPNEITELLGQINLWKSFAMGNLI
jgi:hypothetical protein